MVAAGGLAAAGRFTAPFTFCIFAFKDDSHQPSMNATLRRAKRRITVVRASRNAKGPKTKDERP
jgi:hypothetical protein